MKILNKLHDSKIVVSAKDMLPGKLYKLHNGPKRYDHYFYFTLNCINTLGYNLLVRVCTDGFWSIHNVQEEDMRWKYVYCGDFDLALVDSH